MASWLSLSAELGPRPRHFLFMMILGWHLTLIIAPSSSPVRPPLPHTSMYLDGHECVVGGVRVGSGGVEWWWAHRHTTGMPTI